jgi:hypothetical protein
MTPTITPKRVTGIVDKIVEKYRLLLRYMTLGPSSLTRSQIKLLLKEGMLKPKYYRATLVDAYYASFNKLLTSPPTRSIQDFTIKHIQESAGALIDKFADGLSQDIGSVLNRHILNYSKQLRDTTKEELTEGFLKEKTVGEMVQSLRDKTRDYYKNFNRIITTELSRAQNLGAMDAILTNNKNKSQDEIYVYVSGSHRRRCKKCAELYYHPDGSPRVFKMSELLANGTNYGKKQADWDAVIPPLHPNCTDILLELPAGYGFRNGKLSYIAKDHNEYSAQNS